MSRSAPVLDRLFAKTTPGWNGCVVFTGAHSATYGQIWWNRAQHLAHRVAYELMVGPIPDGNVIDHLCSNRSCVNPHHLEPVTQDENVRRAGTPMAARQSAKTRCRRGHEYDLVNTYYAPGTGHRQCRECNRISRRERNAR
jgi:hypothetical protein